MPKPMTVPIQDEGVKRDKAEDGAVHTDHDDALEPHYLLDWGVTRPLSGRERARRLVRGFVRIVCCS